MSGNLRKMACDAYREEGFPFVLLKTCYAMPRKYVQYAVLNFCLQLPTVLTCYSSIMSNSSIPLKFLPL